MPTTRLSRHPQSHGEVPCKKWSYFRAKVGGLRGPCYFRLGELTRTVAMGGAILRFVH